MFTGLVDNTGKFISLEGRRIIRIKPEIPYDDLEVGESISVNGACLTLLEEKDGTLSFEVSPETLKRTNLGTLRPGDWVNLERALRLGDRLGGHIVLGHVDTTGRIERIEMKGDFRAVTVSYRESQLKRYIVEKGSITVDGISLTVNRSSVRTFQVMIITHTFLNTNLKHRKVGDYVNIEVDILGKYVESLLEKGSSLEDKLRAYGFDYET